MTLTERLRRTYSALDHNPDVTRPVNPDGPEAADKIEAQDAEIAKLNAEVKRWWKLYTAAQTQSSTPDNKDKQDG